MLAKITAHKEEPLQVKFAKGIEIILNPSESGEFDLTGDQIGTVEATLVAQTSNPMIRGTGGSVSCQERALSEQNPPMGSKKDRALNPEKYGPKASTPAPVKPAVKPAAKTDKDK